MKFILIESKEDQEKFLTWAGQELYNKFYKIKDRLKGEEKDIYYWMKKTPDKLSKKIDSLLSVQTRSQKERDAQKGAELVSENEYYKVYHIMTFEASKKYGENTKWCITGSTSGWGQPEGTSESYYWDDYTSQGVQFYFFISKKSDDEKYALVLYPDVSKTEIYNSKDELVNFIPNAPDDFNFLTNDKGVLVKYIGDCDDIEIPSDITAIGDSAFSGCHNIFSVFISDGVTSIGKEAFWNCSNLENIELPNSIKEIGAGAFEGCVELHKITLPNGLTNINDYMFTGCYNLEDVYIPNSVLKIGSNAFSGCDSLIDVNFLPEGLVEIGGLAFLDCSSLRSIVFPKSLKKICGSAFNGCVSLTDITVPDSVTYLGDGTFCNCSGLEHANIFANIEILPKVAFVWCGHLKSAFLPKSIKSIEVQAFSYCPQFTDVYFEGTEEDWGNISIDKDNDGLFKATIHFNSKRGLR